MINGKEKENSGGCDRPVYDYNLVNGFPVAFLTFRVATEKPGCHVLVKAFALMQCSKP